MLGNYRSHQLLEKMLKVIEIKQNIEMLTSQFGAKCQEPALDVGCTCIQLVCTEKN